ncbi:MAG: hypothetical protein R3324_10805, partial [Halobacteriales archaeon]|nr:hypothetical protein [Halobacteriales archaeon]
LDGTPGEQLSVIYSKEFVAGVDEFGVTRVEIFEADTVLSTIPFDTLIDIRVQRQLFVQAEPVVAADTLLIDAQVEIDGRRVFDDSGLVLSGVPWRYLYRFNQQFTAVIEVVF